jgi:hypothetical protein
MESGRQRQRHEEEAKDVVTTAESTDQLGRRTSQQGRGGENLYCKLCSDQYTGTQEQEARGHEGLTDDPRIEAVKNME